jgi:peptide/nickel transport system permease protein
MSSTPLSIQGSERPEIAVAAAPQRRRGREAWLPSLIRQKPALLGAAIVCAFLMIAIVGPPLAPYGPTEQQISQRLHPPSLTHVFGTDEFGRDILSRLLHGAWISLQVGVIAVGASSVCGSILGLIAGYRGGWLDDGLVLLMDVVFAFPAILLAIAIIAVLGSSLQNVMLAIAVVNTPTFMRVVRGSTRVVRTMPFIEAAVAVGASMPRVLARHVFPNVTAPLIVSVSLNFAFAVLAEASLAFLGLGNRPPAPSWGSMVSSSYGFLEIAPWVPLVPGTALALTVLGFNLLGDGLRDLLDPRLRV